MAGEMKYWSKITSEVVSQLESDGAVGLGREEAKIRLAKYGRNSVGSYKRTPGIQIWFNQLKSPLILVLIFAGIVTIGISHLGDAAFIFVAVIVNSILGYYQENKAEDAISKLKMYLIQKARVIREGKEQEVDAEEIVPGDVIRLTAGDRVPADARIISVNDFQVDESVLTGESLPIGKTEKEAPENATLADQTSMIFAGTLVIQGECVAVVCKTGVETELGKIATMVSQSENEKTPLQLAITKFSLNLSVVLGVMTVIVFVIGVLAGQSVLEMFLTSVAIAVSAIPEGLPISMTVILAVGVERMAKRKGVVRKLVAAEALGSTTVILTDKTGTLTMAEMSMSSVIPWIGSEDDLINSALCNVDVKIDNPDSPSREWKTRGRIMEVALIKAVVSRGRSVPQVLDKASVVKSMPFNPIQKYSISLVDDKAGRRLVFLGAPDILISYAKFTKKKREEVTEQIEKLAISGERVLGLAIKKLGSGENVDLKNLKNPSDLNMVGLLTFRDPVRPGVKGAIARIKKAGVRTVIMTGDHKGTAMAVAAEVGLIVDESTVLDASELVKLSKEELTGRLKQLNVISRVTPLDKLNIAKLYQELGEVVAMTGDGVNDAPSIKQANVGVAMGSGTEVAQSVADLVLLDDNFETIVAAIEEGRRILDNIRKVLVYLLSNVLDGLILIGGSLVLGVPLPLNALQILWVNFFTDSFPAVSFAFEKGSYDEVNNLSTSDGQLFDPLMKFLVLGIGISTSILQFAMYYWLLEAGYDPAIVRTFIFATFGTYTLMLAFSVRSLSKSIFSYPVFANKYLTWGIAVGLILMGIAIYVPGLQGLFETVALPLNWLVGVFLIGILNISLIEVGKFFFRRNEKVF